MSSNKANWEKVGKSKTNTKTQKRTTTENMPRHYIEVEPLKLTKSMFDAVADKPKQQSGSTRKPLQNQTNNQSSPRGSNKQKPKKPKKPTASKYNYDSFQEAVQDLSVTTVHEHAKLMKETVSIWQKPVALFINDMISCPDESSAFLNKNFGYPLSKVPSGVYNMMYELFIEKSTDIVKELLFDHCVSAMLDCMNKDQPTWGYRLCIQVLAHGGPKVCIADVQRDSEKIDNMKNNPRRCLSYMWALGQVGYKDPQCGMNVWLKLMLPMIGEKKFAGYVVHYLECILPSTKDTVGRLSGTIDAKNFLQIMKWTYNPSTSLAPDLRERLSEKSQTIQQIAIGNEKLKLLLFEKFLQTSPAQIEYFRPIILEIVFQCLLGNPSCFKKWRDVYTISLPQTKLLLEFLEGNWGRTVKLSRKQFTEMISDFNAQNNDAATRSLTMTSVNEFKTVNSICRHMNQKLSKESSGTLSRCNHVMLSILVALVAVAVALLIYDLHTHDGIIENSTTYKAMESSGTLELIKKAWDNVTSSFNIVTKWLQDNVPYYWTRVNHALGPYIALFASWISNVSQWILEVTAPVRALLGEYAKLALDLVEQLFQKLLVVSKDVFMSLRPSLVAFGSWMDAKLVSTIAFMNGEFGWCCVRDAVTENAISLYKSSCDGALFMWSYVLHVFKIATDYVSGENM